MRTQGEEESTECYLFEDGPDRRKDERRRAERVAGERKKMQIFLHRVDSHA